MSQPPARAATDADLHAAAIARWDNEGGSLDFTKVPKREKDEALPAFTADKEEATTAAKRA